MKFLKGIGFLFLMAAVFVCGFWFGMEGHAFFYPGDVEAQPPEKAVPVTYGEERLTADTVYEVIEINRSDGTKKDYQTSVPSPYLGMNREQFLERMEQYKLSPPLTELENGFVSLEVSRFSRSRVTVYKYYETEQEPEDFWLQVENHYIVIYRRDRQTRYELTDIYVPRLPEEVQQELMEGKVINGEDALYNFLESYSS